VRAARLVRHLHPRVDPVEITMTITMTSRTVMAAVVMVIMTIMKIMKIMTIIHKEPPSSSPAFRFFGRRDF
jgi:hypothetical protein